MKCICFDIGGTKILKAVADIKGDSYKFLNMEEDNNPRKPQKIKELLTDYCLRSQKIFQINRVGISTAKIVDPKNNLVRNARNCYGAEVFNFNFLKELGFVAKLENDGRCFALGEYHFGKYQKSRSSLTLTLGTGIGGGFTINNLSLQGTHNSALEVSHIWLSYKGKWSKWCELASGSGIEKSYFKLAKKKLTSQEIFNLSKKNNRFAQKAIKQAENFLGIGTANLVNILDPQVIIFGGGISEQKDFIKKSIEVAKKNVFNKKANYRFTVSSLKHKANLLGAIMNLKQRAGVKK